MPKTTENQQEIQISVSRDELRMLGLLEDVGMTPSELKQMLAKKKSKLEGRSRDVPKDEEIIREVEDARTLLESIIENAQTVCYRELKKSVGILNRAALAGEYLKFESNGKLRAIMLPVGKANHVHRLLHILQGLKLVEGDIQIQMSIPEFISQLDK